ncbi:MAG: ABC transporter ATP-binding protein [Candidatus Parcubacteria bacterium]|nr:ABC transporter ATP-binding protein [Burkholderiales bacterium]
MLKISRVRKSFGAVAALDGVSLDLNAGEFVSFLGPSGCGKTTLLRIVAGLEEPDAGEVWIGAERLVGGGEFVLPERRGFGMVFQSYALWPHMTVFQNLAYPLDIQKRPNAEVGERVQAMLSSLGLAGYGERRPSQLSGGQQQRVALGRALITRPRVLLLDEPLSNVDAKVRQEMRLEIRRVQQATGVSAIYVTHDQTEALAMSDRVVVMNHGHVEQVGPPEEIYRRPASAFVADFMGCNLLAGKVLGAGSARVTVQLPGLGMEIGLSGSALPGGDVQIAAHIEDVRIVPHSSPGAGSARALVSSYLGERVEVEVECQDGRRLTAVLSAQAERPARGSEVGVALDPDRLWLIQPGEKAVR